MGITAAVTLALLIRFDRSDEIPIGEIPIPKPEVILPITTNRGQEFTPSLSPDGNLLAYSWAKSGTISIWIRQADLGTPICLTSAAGRNGAAAWSPDGRFIAFARRSVNVDDSGLFVIPALGGTERRLLAAAEIGDLEWLHDGKSIVFTIRRAAGAPYAVERIDVSSRVTRAITHPPADTFGDYRVAVSPDGARVAFERVTDSSNANDVYVTDIAGGEPRRITFDAHVIVGLAWDRALDAILFSSDRDGRRILWKVPAAGGTPVPLEPTVEDAFEPSISRDGHALAYTRITSDTNSYRSHDVMLIRNYH